MVLFYILKQFAVSTLVCRHTMQGTEHEWGHLLISSINDTHYTDNWGRWTEAWLSVYYKIKRRNADIPILRWSSTSNIVTSISLLKLDMFSLRVPFTYRLQRTPNSSFSKVWNFVHTADWQGKVKYDLSLFLFSTVQNIILGATSVLKTHNSINKLHFFLSFFFHIHPVCLAKPIFTSLLYVNLVKTMSPLLSFTCLSRHTIRSTASCFQACMQRIEERRQQSSQHPSPSAIEITPELGFSTPTSTKQLKKRYQNVLTIAQRMRMM